MKSILKSAMAIVFITIVFACNQTSKPVETTVKDSTSHSIVEATYTCTMHPEVSSNKPGKCPKCGMDLVRKENSQLPDSAAVLTDSVEHLNKSN